MDNGPTQCVWPRVTNSRQRGDDVLSRVTGDTRVIAVDIPNTQAASALPWGNYRVSVSAIEASTGLNLFDQIPAALQNELEAGVDNGPTE